MHGTKNRKTRTLFVSTLSTFRKSGRIRTSFWPQRKWVAAALFRDGKLVLANELLVTEFQGKTKSLAYDFTLSVPRPIVHFRFPFNLDCGWNFISRSIFLANDLDHLTISYEMPHLRQWSVVPLFCWVIMAAKGVPTVLAMKMSHISHEWLRLVKAVRMPSLVLKRSVA